jgi:thiamine-monophosphate kinase
VTEQEWIEYLRRFLPQNKEILASAEEDCAVIKLQEKNYLLFTTDALVEGIHFKLDYYTFFDLGYKLSAVNLSDIAAMGGTPLYAVLTLGSNLALDKAWLDPLLEGINACLGNYSAKLVGGDTVKSPAFFVNLALVGVAERPVLRSTAKPGDEVFVSRPLGASSAFLRLIKEKPLEEIPEEVRLAHLRPEPEVELGRELSQVAESMIDISDGLLLDLYRICRPSKFGAIVEVEKIPIASCATLDEALAGGEDFALLFTVSKEKLSAIPKIEESLNRKLYKVGKIIPERKLFIKENGGLREIAPRGYDHFTSQLQP